MGTPNKHHFHVLEIYTHLKGILANICITNNHFDRVLHCYITGTLKFVPMALKRHDCFLNNTHQRKNQGNNKLSLQPF